MRFVLVGNPGLFVNRFVPAGGYQDSMILGNVLIYRISSLAVKENTYSVPAYIMEQLMSMRVIAWVLRVRPLESNPQLLLLTSCSRLSAGRL